MASTITALQVKGYAAHKAGADLAPFEFQRRERRFGGLGGGVSSSDELTSEAVAVTR